MTNALLKSSHWGDLLRDREVEAGFADEAMLRHFIAFEQAWTQALVACGIVDRAAGDRAHHALADLSPDFEALGRAVVRDGLPVPELVKQVRSGLDEEAAKAVHSGATSQDVIDTSLVLTMTALLQSFEIRLNGILARMDALRDQDGGKMLMARTRMQAALPISVSDRINDWSAPLIVLRDELHRLIDRISVLQAGGPVGLGAHHPEFRDRVGKALGLRADVVWQTDRQSFADIGHWLTKVAGALGKFGQDIALMAQQGVDEVRIEGAGGSSAMPHKQNPVRSEVLVAIARVMAGHQGTLALALVHEQERSGTSMAIEWMMLPTMFETTGAALNLGRDLADQIQSLGPSTG